MRLPLLVVVLVASCFGGCFNAGSGRPPPLACVVGADCPFDLVCLATVGRCVPADDACIDRVEREATPQPDGNTCADGICIAASCVAPRCGDLVVTPPETCDGDVGCRADCTRCGDGNLDDEEACDNGDQNSDLAPGACRSSCAFAACGDGVRDPGEACDDGALNDDDAPDACRATCARASCGDGAIDDGEDCDDGPANDDLAADACRTTCQRSSCGDGVIDAGEICDDGPANSDVRPGACRTGCQPARCGDGVRDVGEGCDEGAANDDDGVGACRTTCALASCGDGVLDPVEDCDDGDNNRLEADACRPTCLLPDCGDGVVDSGEACDSGAANSDIRGNACRTTCQLPRCGDSTIDVGEVCDEGQANSDVAAGACRTTCARATCGDGVVDPQESCDDGNRVGGDGCSGNCLKTERCGDGVVDEGEGCDDGDDNPRDGCDACALQTWDHELIVSGAIEGRDPLRVAMSANGVAIDGLGRVLVADSVNHRIRRVDVDGSIRSIAGTGEAGFAGDGGPATSAQLRSPTSVAVDASGRVSIADTGNCRVRVIEVDGRIATVAGTGNCTASGDGGPALSAGVRNPRDITVDLQGRLVIVDRDNSRVRRVGLDGVITTVAGGTTSGGPGDGGPATSARLSGPRGVAVDLEGRLLIVDLGQRRIRRVELNGIITTVAGNGSPTFSGDGGLATAAGLALPEGVAVDPEGRILIADESTNRIRRVDENGVITTAVGDGTEVGAAALSRPNRLAVGSDGVVYVTAQFSSVLIRVDTDRSMSRFAGGRGVAFLGEDGPAISATLGANSTMGLAADRDGRVFVGFDGVRIIEPGGFLSLAPQTFGSFATEDLTIDDRGRIFIADTFNDRIRRLDPDGSVVDIAGSFNNGFDGDGGPATSASLAFPSGVTVDEDGVVYLADSGNTRIRQVDLDGIITTVAGEFGELISINDVAFGNGGVYFTDDQQVRFLHPDGFIENVAGNGARGFSGDGGLATAAALFFPSRIAVADNGDLLIVDLVNNRIRRVDDQGIIRTIAGNGTPTPSGDGGPAILAGMRPENVAVDAEGRVLISDDDRFVRRIEHDGTITTIGGAVQPRGPGLFARAQLYGPQALLAGDDGVGILSVGTSGRMMRVDLTRGVVEVVLGYANASPLASDRSRFAPLLGLGRGVALDPARNAIVVVDGGGGTLRVVGVDVDDDDVVDDPSTWSHSEVPGDLAGTAGIVHDPATDTFVVADELDHCVRRLDRAGSVVGVVFGRCGTRGVFPGFLSGPTHVAISPTTGALYIADTGNHRVLRVVDGAAALVLGDGSPSSAGEGAPARTFPVHAPRQLALDRHGNLYVTSTTTVRLVTSDDDGDDSGGDADGDDRVFTVFGGGERTVFPESDARCLGALAIDSSDDVYVADACDGFLVRVRPAP